MNNSILIHKNSYSKTHSAITRGFLSLFPNIRLLNIHNNLYDTALSIKPQAIVFQMEEYTQEIHQFVNDPSINITSIITIDDNPSLYQKYVSIIQDLFNKQALGAKYIVPAEIYATLVSSGVAASKLIGYNRLYNDLIFRNENKTRNDKILCILDKDPACVDLVKQYLYPNTKHNIIMVNNPEIEYDQNVGLAFDEDMNKLLNECNGVLDLSGSYDAEIMVCGTPAYQKIVDWIDATPKPYEKDITPVTNFIQNIIGYLQ
jgi:hypothetical protein